MEKSNSGNFKVVIDQDEVTQEVKDIAVKYDPLNRTGQNGFHVTDDGELHIDDQKVIKEHKIIEKKIPNDAVEVIELPSESGKLVHQYNKNGFRLFNLPIPNQGDITGILGPNGIGKTTILEILAGIRNPNFGDFNTEYSTNDFKSEYSGTRLEDHVKSIIESDSKVMYKPQRVSESQIPGNPTVREFLRDRDRNLSYIKDELEISEILDQDMSSLSGGERQRVYIAGSLLTEADVYLIDEPSSFLDIRQRFKIGSLIRDFISDTGSKCVVVEHDLAVLDLISDNIHIVYGESSAFGVTSKKLSSRRGINDYIEGYLTREDIQIREGAIDFSTVNQEEDHLTEEAFTYPDMTKTFDEFSLNIKSGCIYDGEVVAIVGQNALGKSTFAKILAGEFDSDQKDIENHSVSYKPQYPSSNSSKTVRQIFQQVTDIQSGIFRNRVYNPLRLDSIFDRKISSLSGGEVQRVSIALCLAREAEIYLIDEPSAYLDVETREEVASVIKRFARNSSDPVMVIDHDLFVIDRIADRIINFEGEPGKKGRALQPKIAESGINYFLSDIGITFRRDSRTNRPRSNKQGSQLDREQKRNNEYY